MILVNPIQIGSAHVSASNLPANDHALYSSSAAYNSGDKVSFNAVNYECTANGTTNVQPDSGSSAWLNLGSVNRLAMFDGKNLSNTVGDLDIELTFAANKLCNALALLNVEASAVDVVMTDPVVGEVYNQSFDLVDRGVNDLYEYFFVDPVYKSVFVVNDLPPYKSASISVKLHRKDESTPAQAGTCVVGRQRNLGDLKWGYGIGIDDYSQVDFDQFGEVSIVQRGYANTADLPVSVPTAKVDYVRQLLAQYRATKVLWIGAIDRPETVVFGIYESFSQVISNPVDSSCNLSLKGTI